MRSPLDYWLVFIEISQSILNLVLYLAFSQGFFGSMFINKRSTLAKKLPHLRIYRENFKEFLEISISFDNTSPLLTEKFCFTRNWNRQKYNLDCKLNIVIYF